MPRRGPEAPPPSPLWGGAKGARGGLAGGVLPRNPDACVARGRPGSPAAPFRPSRAGHGEARAELCVRVGQPGSGNSGCKGDSSYATAFPGVSVRWSSTAKRVW